MNRRRFFIRSMDAGDRLEVFMVSAIAAILIIRAYLHLTGYPQLGDSNLHIAHMLWGGLGMLVSIIILMTFLGKTSEQLAVIIGGIGFGTFIDEVGKFITQDNDYFFQPSVAIIYTIFVLLFLIVRTIQTRRHYSETEYLMNAIREMEEIALHDLDSEERSLILERLDKSAPGNPMVSQLRQIIEKAHIVPTPEPSLLRRIKERLIDHYRVIAGLRWFRLGMIAFFLFQMMASFSYVAGLVLASQDDALSWIEWLQMISSTVSAILVLWGVLALQTSRLKALRLFERSILVSIFFTQVFVFYQEEFGGLMGLGLNLVILMGLRFMIARERAANMART